VTHEVLILPLTVHLRHMIERLTCISMLRPHLESAHSPTVARDESRSMYCTSRLLRVWTSRSGGYYEVDQVRHTVLGSSSMRTSDVVAVVQEARLQKGLLPDEVRGP